MITLDILSLMDMTLVSLVDKTFLYPTDSLYGLWAFVSYENVLKINNIKKRSPGKSYSIVAPSYTWIEENFVVKDFYNTRKDYYTSYGPVTVLCKRRDPSFLSYVSDNDYVGIRIIDHPFQQFVEKIWLPFLSTSANISGEWYNEDAMKTLFSDTVDYYIINSSPMTKIWSTLIYYDNAIIINR